ncbi:MAG: hypothetical protein HY960_11000 [Ignavibacteriae bacterium]|nr:hypothetical protein [Ignavibacteriota bacterium]
MAKNKTEALDVHATKIYNFLDKYFPSMPMKVKVFVYKGMFILLGLIIGVMLFLVVYPVITETDDLVIRGEIIGSDERSLPIGLLQYEAMGDGMFIKKKIKGSVFVYEWILHIPKSDMNQMQTLVLAKYFGNSQGGWETYGELRFSAEDLLHHVENDRVTMFIEYAGSIPMKILFREKTNKLTSHRFFPIDVFNIAYAQPFLQEKTISSEEAKKILDNIKVKKNPFEQLKLQSKLSNVETPFLQEIAVTVRDSIASESFEELSLYLMALTEHDSVGTLTSAGTRKDILSQDFYFKAVSLLDSGSAIERKKIASFLYRIQDSRSIKPLYNKFLRTNDLEAKGLCVYVLGSFANNSDENVRDRVKRQLNLFYQNETSLEVKMMLLTTLKKYDNKESVYH